MKREMRDSFVFDGVQLGPSTNFLELVREQLKDGSVWASGDSGPRQGVRRVLDAAEGTRAERSLISAVLELIGDEDVAVRTGAISLSWDYADRITADSLLKALVQHPTLYEGVKPVGVPETYMPDLAWGLIQAMNASPHPDQQVITRLRQAADDPVNGFRVLGGLAAHDATWLIEHASRLVSGQPTRARIIMANLKGARHREQFVRALSQEPAPFRKDLAAIVQEKVQSADERHRLSEILLQR